MWPGTRTTRCHGCGAGLVPAGSHRPALATRDPFLGLGFLHFSIRGRAHRHPLRRLFLKMTVDSCSSDNVASRSILVCEHVFSISQVGTTHAAATHDFLILHPLEPVLRIGISSALKFSFLLFCSSRIMETILLVYICVCTVSLPAHGACSCLPSHLNERRLPTSTFQLMIRQGFLMYRLESPNFCLRP